MVYVRSYKGDTIEKNLVTAKLKIVPSIKLTVPRLELMSCLLFVRLIVTIKKAISTEVKILRVAFWSDSKLLCGGSTLLVKNWKVWVKNRLTEISENIGVDCWRFVPTDYNLEDITTSCHKKMEFNEVFGV